MSIFSLRRLITVALLSISATAAHAQIGIGTNAPNAKAALEVSATDKGLLIPRMDSAQRAAITPTPDGLMVFQTDGRKGFWYAVSGTWYFIPDKTRSGDNLGNHAATQPLNLGTHKLVGNGGTSGLEVSSDGGLLATGTHVGDYPPILTGGEGTRMMWLPNTSSFRAGYVNGTQWDFANIGDYSVAMGYNSRASGDYAAAFGNACTAANTSSFAAGEGNTATGIASVALGYYAHTNSRRGSFVFADQANFPNGSNSAGAPGGENNFKATVNNTFNVRCIGGFNFYTTLDLSVGVKIAAGGNAWTTVSDSTKKERIRVADGDAFLAHIGRMRLGSWNYKQQDAATQRHYGPMAQDFYAAFGHDGVGTIGEPTAINQADFDGVNLIAIQALYRRLLRVEAENDALRWQAELTARRLDAYGPPAAEARR
jgi:Chaperone of endosialidase/Head domain of trimeric autotransporter adhesin